MTKMSKIIKSACALDCFDACAMLVTVEEGKVTKVTGDPDHPITKGYICNKGRAHVDRMYSVDRLLYPLKKNNGRFNEISWEEAIDLITQKLQLTLNQKGPQSIIHVFDNGYSGISKSVDEMFFNHLGGISTSKSPGSLCWKAGNVAQQIDFGTARGHSAEDLANSKCMIIWGRNPAATNIHFMQALRDVKKNGGQVICIDPFRTKTAELSTWHLPVKPGSDGALAFAIARILMENNLFDDAFVENHTVGFEAYKQEVMNFDMDQVEKIIGIPYEDIEKLALTYGNAKPASIVLGYGMQRYVNGGHNIRAINALGALTGNIGVSGGGVTYANKSISKYVSGYVPESEALVENARYYKPAEVASYIQNAKDPEINFVWISKANPVVQVPDTKGMIRALKQTEFVVVVDMFMTDTAKEADLVLPATSIFEESDFIYSSMYSPYLCYAEKCVDAPTQIVGEYELFQILADKMGLDMYPNVSKDVFFKRAFKPLIDTFDLNYEDLKKQSYAIPDQGIPWFDRRFKTPSGKFEFESEVAQQMGLNAVTKFVAPLPISENYPLRLITPHAAQSTNSQHFRNKSGLPEIFIPVEDAQRLGIELDEEIIVRSELGEIKVIAKPDGAIPVGVVKIIEGQWCDQGSVNTLIGDKTCEYGDQAAYYDTFVKLLKSDFAK